MSIRAVYRTLLNGPTGLWSPLRLGSALELWLDGNDTTTQTLDVNRVTEWRDKSPNTRVLTQPAPLRQPTVALNSLNGRQGISFNGFSNSMFSTTPFPITGDPNFSAFVIYQKRSPNQGTVYSWGSTSVALGSMILFDNNVLTGYAYAGDNNYRIPALLANTPIIQGYTKASGAIDVTSVASTDGEVVDPGGHSALTPNIQSSPFWVGGFNNVADFYLDGVVYEIVIASIELPATLRFTVEGYLAHRWGVEAQLPLAHPFRFIAP